MDIQINVYGYADYSCLRNATITGSDSLREVQFSVPLGSSYEDQYTIHWNGSCVLQHLYAPNDTDILQLEKKSIYDYFTWGFVYMSFKPVPLGWRYGLNGEGLWRIQMKVVDPTVPSLCVSDDFRVSIHYYEWVYETINLAVGESYATNLPSVPDWYTGAVDHFYINANSSQVDVSGALLQHSYHSDAYDWSYWRPYNQTIIITNIWTDPLSLGIQSRPEIFRYIDHEANGQGLEFILDSVAFDSTRAGNYFTLDITAPISLKSTSLYVPNGSRADALYRILEDSIDYSYYTLGVNYGVYKVNFNPYYAWMVLENGIYGSWRLMLEIPSDSNPPIIGVPLQEPDPYHAEPDDNVTVSVNVTDIESGVREVILSYTTDNGTTWENVTMSERVRYNSTTALYEGKILEKPYGTWVKYKIIAYDNAGNPAVKDNAGNYYSYQIIPEFPSFMIIPLFMSLMTLAVVLARKRAHTQTKHHLETGE